MLGLPQRAARLPLGHRVQFPHDSLVSSRKGTLSYEEFDLQELRDRARFDQFYCIFERGGLLPSRLQQQPRALELLRKTADRQKTVGDKLYREYQWRRLELIEHLNRKENKDLNEAIRIAQKLLDRIIFIAFCEDRELLPEKLLEATRNDVRMYSRAKNPAWENFLDLFTAIDKGAKGKREIAAFNGGLFADDPAINALELAEEKWTNAFAGFGIYDFSEEVNVDVLGHLFERSITELEKLRVGGLFALMAGVEDAETANGTMPIPGRKKRPAAKTAAGESPLSKMPKSAQRKRFGIYYTPPAFTGLIVERTVDALVLERFAALQEQHGVNPEARTEQDSRKLLAYCSDCLEVLQKLTVCDPACGSGAFLIRAYEALDAHYKTVVHGLAGAGQSAEAIAALEDAIPDLILQNNLYGVDLSEQAVEITQLALWIRSARKGHTLADLSRNIICGNSLVSDDEMIRLSYPDTERRPRAMGWESAFPAIFDRPKPGFDCVIGNPPWERVKLEEREFFGLQRPEVAIAANAADRRKLIATLESENPELWDRYQAAQASASRMLDYVRTKDAGFSLTGKGDVNLYMLFAELGRRIVSADGRVGLLLPSGIATDHTTKEFFGELVSSKTLSAVYDFVNRLGLFPDVEGRLKFCVLLFGGIEQQSNGMDFVFWAERVENIAEKSRHVVLSARDIKLMNPNTLTCPIFRHKRDGDLAKRIYKRVPVLIDEGRRQGGNPWGARFVRMFDQTNDSALFGESEAWQKKGYKLSGNCHRKDDAQALPLMEAKMTRDYDHRASTVTMNVKNAYMNYAAESVSLVDHQNPEFLPIGRYWVSEEDIVARAPESLSVAAIGFHDIARANDTRTMVAAMVPFAAYSNTLPLIVKDAEHTWRRFCCLAGNLNCYAYDFLVRQKANNAHLNFFIVEQIPTLPPETYADKCPWSKKETLEKWISERVLKLTCTAEDMLPLAAACDFKGSRGDGVHIWKESERAEIRAELDAAYFLLYGIARNDAEYILSTFSNTGLLPEDERDSQQLLFSPGSTGRMVLDALDRLGGK